MTEFMTGPAATPAPGSASVYRAATYGYALVCRILVAMLVGTSACRGDVNAAGRELAGVDARVAVRPIRAVSYEALADSALILGMDIVQLGDTLYVADPVADRLALFDTLLRSVGFLGTKGAGPGELMDPTRLSALGDHLAIGELGNGRISVFDRQGRLRATYGVPARFRAVELVGDGSAIAVTGSLVQYLVSVDTTGTLRTFASKSRGDIEKGRDSVAAEHGPPHDLIARVGTDFWLFDNSYGVLRRFDAGGALMDELRLPNAYLEMAGEERSNIAYMFGHPLDQIHDLPLAKDLAANERGELLLLCRLAEGFGMLIDPQARTVAVLPYPADSTYRDILQRASSAVFSGQRVTAVTEARLATVELERSP